MSVTRLYNDLENLYTHSCMCPCNQMQCPLAMHTLVLVLVQSSWTMLAAVVVKGISLLVYVAGISTVTEATMLELGVKVDFMCS